MMLQPAMVWGRVVSISEAELFAHDWMAREFQVPQLRRTKGELSIQSIRPLLHDLDSIGFLAEFKPKGFMLVSGLTEMAPAPFIAYDVDFEKAKGNPILQSILEQMYLGSCRLGYLQAGGKSLAAQQLQASSLDYEMILENEQLWEKSLTRSFSSEGSPPPLRLTAESAGDWYVFPMLTSLWDQGWPTESGTTYNMDCPILDGKHTYAGCAAISQAQLMYYWKYPASGTGSHSYAWQGQLLSANFSHPYYWSQMRDDYSTGTESDEEREAVARLISDVGISIETNYGLEGSGVRVRNHAHDETSSLKAFFNYSPVMRDVFRLQYTNWANWFEVIKAQMDKKMPVLLAFLIGGDGHSVVVDGYRTDAGNLIHINMGWGGVADAYYSMSNILDTPQFQQGALIDIHPPEGSGQTITVVSPNGGEVWLAGSVHTISWNTAGNIPAVSISYSSDNGSSFSPIAAQVPNSGSYSWTAPPDVSANCLVRVTEGSGTLSDQSDAPFTIAGEISAEVERGTLVSIYQATGGPQWYDRSGWMNSPGTECSWKGVTCNDQGYIVGLSLPWNNLAGTIPPTICNLAYLQELNLAGFGLGGDLPSSLWDCLHLTSLDLDGNRLTGRIPPQISNLKDLEELNLSGNLVAGILPPEIGQLGKLRQLALWGNRLSGPIPAEMGKLGELTYLDLSYNQLFGSMPPEMAGMQNLTSLRLNDNFLTGITPNELSRLSLLMDLDLSNNRLSGFQSDFAGFPNLTSLRLSSNQIAGEFPPWIARSKGLQYLDLSQNMLYGGLPSWLGNLTELRYLWVTWNQLNGPIPPELVRLRKLESLSLDINRFTGTIPLKLLSLPELRELNLQANDLSGTIPSVWGYTSKLYRLDLEANHLVGTIPESLGNLSQLTYLNLSNNKLSGEIPFSLMNLTGLYEGGTKIDNNALSTMQGELSDFLAAKCQCDWKSTQTLPPVELKAVPLSDTRLSVTWQLPPGSSNPGSFNILSSKAAGGPYQIAYSSPNKGTLSSTLDNLEPGTSYFLVAQTVTNPVMGNANTVSSQFSPEIVATTTGIKNDEAPQLSGISPPSGSVVSQTILVEAIANDDKGIKKVEFYLDGVRKGESGGPSYSFSWNTTLDRDGPHKLKVKAIDTSDQVTEKEILLVVNNGFRTPAARKIENEIDSQLKRTRSSVRNQ